MGNSLKSILRHGLAATITLQWNRLRERIYERRLGIQSADIISLKELDLEHEERREHWPTQFYHFRSMEKFLRPETPNDVFIDYGAGLGRMLILAAMLPFKRVIGIEISPKLVERARDNISRCRGNLRCKDIQVLTVDAMAFELPTDATTIYFNNPFSGEVLATVLKKIKLSYGQRPRPIKLVCNLPLQCAFRDQISKADGFELQQQVNLWNNRQCLVFSMTRGK
jgi:16S rRNA G966 N2-methylase RsmD